MFDYASWRLPEDCLDEGIVSVFTQALAQARAQESAITKEWLRAVPETISVVFAAGHDPVHLTMEGVYVSHEILIIHCHGVWPGHDFTQTSSMLLINDGQGDIEAFTAWDWDRPHWELSLMELIRLRPSEIC